MTARPGMPSPSSKATAAAPGGELILTIDGEVNVHEADNIYFAADVRVADILLLRRQAQHLQEGLLLLLDLLLLRQLRLQLDVTRHAQWRRECAHRWDEAHAFELPQRRGHGNNTMAVAVCERYRRQD
eukprot:CAMPEP_0118864026 /NCGR_PEP_ID=MMETSP1163-20130328/8715_1 /TAXON_ID=124430 /ORGANISM="Phaeomonas parva, Strain CCMP2877" /LENGTH=127 /DNA_ID=CAMNT_0006798095 /DNA_START=278 /DNA_END=662 /DNA_ORIENTATION=-